MEEEKHSHINNKILVGILFILIALIIGLIVWMVVVKLNEKDEIADGGDETPFEVQMMDASEISSSIEETYFNNNDMEMAIRSYDEKIAEAKSMGKIDLQEKLMSFKGRFLSYNGECDRALSYFDEADLSGLSGLQLGRLYADAYGASVDCSNAEAQEKWLELLSNLTNEN